MDPDPSGINSLHTLPWLASFDVGDNRIDGEHRALIDCANDLCALAGTRPPAHLLRAAARELIALVEAHFESEETLFPAIGYTERQSHVREHLAIRDGLHRLLLGEAKMAPPEAAATVRLMLVEHLLRHDLGFKTWVQVTQGV